MGFFQNGICLAIYGLCFVRITAAVSVARVESGAIQKREPATCPRSILSKAGDTCESLSSRCGISQDALIGFNSGISCSSLSVEKPVCCVGGGLIIPPKRNSGICYTYTIHNGDTCAKIAKAYGITAENIDTWNKDNLDWYGCDKLQDGGPVCLSTGKPPMPVAVGDAVCGPRVPGSARPLLWTEIAILNPCPAGQCCSSNGQCGTGADFCGLDAAASAVSTLSTKTSTTTTAASKQTSSASSITTSKGFAHLFQFVRPEQATVTTTTKASGSDTSSTKITTNKDSTSTSSTKTKTAASSTKSIITVPSGWSLKMYAGTDCDGNYMDVQGHNKKLEDSDCLLLGRPNNLGSVVNNTAVSCRFWSKLKGQKDWEWHDCTKNRMLKPQSWIMSNGLCTVTPGRECDNYHEISQTYGWRGKGNCQNRGRMDPNFESMYCYVG